MTSSDRWWAIGVTIRTGATEFLAETPPRIWLVTALPRAILQCLFFVLLGRIAGGDDGQRFAFVGAVAAIMTLSTFVGICDVPMTEKWSGTFYRLQLGVLRPATTLLLRVIPWIAEAIVLATAAIVVVGPLTGQLALTGDLLRALPLYLLLACTTAAAGSFGASAAVGRRADVLVGNAFSYLAIATTGVLVPPGRLPLLDHIGTVLPLRNGVLAIRALVAGEGWLGHVLAEAGVGLVWFVLAWTAYTLQSRRALRVGIDDYA